MKNHLNSRRDALKLMAGAAAAPLLSLIETFIGVYR